MTSSSTGGAAGGPGRLVRTAPRGKTRVFVSYDMQHDQDLYRLLAEQSRAPGAGFVVAASSEGSRSDDLDLESRRRRVEQVDQMIVICGEHTERSLQASADLRTAKELKTPYFLLWGRSHASCTKPKGAMSDDGMYRWTPENLRQQIELAARRGRRPPA